MTCQPVHYSKPYFPAHTTSQIVSKIPMREFLEKKGHKAHFTSNVYFVELEGGSYGVLKQVDHEHTCGVIAEVAAYKIARFLGLDFVPQTTLYLENGQIGCVQAYVEPLFDLMEGNKYEEVVNQVDPEEWANIQIFYFVFGQWDPDPSNMIATRHEHGVRLVLIDNAAMGYLQKVKYGEHPFVLYFQDVVPAMAVEPSFPFESVQALPPDKEVWKKQYGHVLSEDQIGKLCQLRWQDVRFVFWKGHLWRQFGFGQPAHTRLYPKKTMDLLEKLTLNDLRGFFHNELGFQFQEEHFLDILERRDQLLQAYRQY